jgi:leucyl aminopeptidase
MVAMKTDMAGGGAVIATMSALRDLGVRVRVTGLVPAAENMPSGSAQRPSDVVTQFGGKTVEVLNTDAEGRLVLADALAYAESRLEPDVVIDLATLTGAISSGLGKRHAGVFCADDRLRAALVAAGEVSGEGIWPMPFVEDYRDALDSTVADVSNVAIGGRDYRGGAIVAALFLREFAGPARWAHLDIAGVGRAEADEHEVVKGPTGYGVRLLLHWFAGSADPQRGLRARRLLAGGHAAERAEPGDLGQPRARAGGSGQPRGPWLRAVQTGGVVTERAQQPTRRERRDNGAGRGPQDQLPALLATAVARPDQHGQAGRVDEGHLR